LVIGAGARGKASTGPERRPTTADEYRAGSREIE
jgi:hypothetical protein